MSASPWPCADAACNSPWIRQYLDHLAGRDASLGPLWAQYQDQLARRDVDQQHDDDFERARLQIRAKAFANTHYWGDLKAIFTKMPGKANPDYAFEACATIAAVRLISHVDYDPLFLFWVDRVKNQVSHTEAVSFWLDRLREEHLDLAACTLQQVYQASADYCEKLWGGYVPKLRFLGRARKKNQQYKSSSTEKNGQSKRARQEAKFTQAIREILQQRPDADGAYICQRLDKRGFPPMIHAMEDKKIRSYWVVWNSKELEQIKNHLQVKFSQVRGQMQTDGKL